MKNCNNKRGREDPRKINLKEKKEMLITFILISAIIIASSQAKNCDTASDDTLYIYPSINNCSKFIVCYRNEEIEMSCLQASMFMFTDERLCLEPCNMKMTAGKKRIRRSVPSYDVSTDYSLFPAIDMPIQTIICPSSGFTSAIIPQNCNEFIECKDGIGVRRKCENGNEFSPSKYLCVESINSDCIVNKRLKASHHSKCRSKEGNSSSFLLPSEKCSDFIKCAKNKAWTITCAQNTSFSREKMSCEWNDEVKCEE